LLTEIASSKKHGLADRQSEPSSVRSADACEAVVRAVEWNYHGQWPGRRIGLRGDTT
jgi:hypothetical protein